MIAAQSGKKLARSIFMPILTFLFDCLTLQLPALYEFKLISANK